MSAIEAVDYEKEIKNIILEQFSNVVVTLEDDFKRNFKRKKHNFLLNQMDETLIANMVFVSSFESKSGNAIEIVAERVARLTFGEENVPKIINPLDLDTSNLNINLERKGQLIVTDVNISNGNLASEISSFRANNVGGGGGRNRVVSGVNDFTIKQELYPLADKYRNDKVITRPVDLVFFDGTYWNLLELKAGGDLDNSNAPANIEKLLNTYVALGIEDVKVYFATLYHKDGEGNTWKGVVKNHINYASNMLIGSAFWNKILPPGVDYTLFTNIYKDALEEIDLNNRVQHLITNSR